ncbi:MAG TPA: sugar ABC transporter ATP-binding protein [Ornithinibacter sp.]|nr:sugar ABC transporter ATP-binding protein [Ornithinibacter sp.]HQA14015.1 sugar ABC transporter ATP-binding protein [Ornithinibacter sp.]HQD68161.1 sugar ABC transporter ATP-binding protein [Ornithinibacter sp.]
MTAATVEQVAATASDPDVVLEAIDIVKTYGVTRALKGVNFKAHRGKVTVLFGENGAGKSTLMKILAGVEQPTAGQLVLDGRPIELKSPTDALSHGIAIIHQELSLFGNLSVRDNIFVGRELLTPAGTVDYAREDRVTRELLSRLELNVPTGTPVEQLRLGQQQLIEIARALEADARILIMDEPTSALSASEVEVLFKVIRDLTAQGVAIIYISHHLEEAIEISDYAVVFRDGDLVATESAKNIDLPWVVAKMVGRDAEYDFRHEPRDYGDVVLDIDKVVVASPEGGGKVAVDGVSIQVRAGEIVCLYGLMGAGRTELMEALAGRDEFVSGDVLLNGRSIKRLGIRERIAAGLGLVPEDRQRDGLVQLMTVGRNLSLSSMARIVKGLFVSRGIEDGLVADKIREVHVKTAGPGALITSLSGGNQQKVVIGRVLMTQPQVILLDEPTRGIDVGAKGEIFALLFELAKQGLAVLYVTSEVGEALTASHRIVVMRKGRIVREFDPRTAERDEVMAASGEAVTDDLHTPAEGTQS